MKVNQWTNNLKGWNINKIIVFIFIKLLLILDYKLLLSNAIMCADVRKNSYRNNIYGSLKRKACRN